MRRILIIEDDAVGGASLLRFLHADGFQCTHVMTFAEGVEASHKSKFDCVVLDLGLPDPDLTSEYAVADRIHEIDAPVVVYTGSGDPEIIKAVRKTGAAIANKPGSALLLEQIWAQINYANPDRESQVAQQEAQRRIQAEPTLTNDTKVSLSLKQMLALIGSIALAAFAVSAKVNGTENSIDKLKTQQENSAAGFNKRLEDIESAVKENINGDRARDKATESRLADWKEWRWGVDQNLRRLGEATKTPIVTKPTQ